MNWFQVDKEIKAKFDQSEAGARRSNELRELDALRDMAGSERKHPLRQLGARFAAAWAHLFPRQPVSRRARGGSSQPRVARAFRKK